MKKQLHPLVGILALVLGISSCGNKEETQQEEAPQSALEAVQRMAQKAEEMQKNGPVDPIDFRKLKEILPQQAAGLKRTEATGEKSGAMGFSISQARGLYQEGEARIEIEILDTGGVGSMAMMGLAAWTMAEVDKETVDGYEKTTTINGKKAYEKYDTSSKDGEINSIIADRYIINIKGRNVAMKQIKETLESMDLDELASLK